MHIAHLMFLQVVDSLVLMCGHFRVANLNATSFQGRLRGFAINSLVQCVSVHLHSATSQRWDFFTAIEEARTPMLRFLTAWLTSLFDLSERLFSQSDAHIGNVLSNPPGAKCYSLTL